MKRQAERAGPGPRQLRACHRVPVQPTDEALMTAYCQGDDRAFTILFARYEERLVGYASKKLGDRSRAVEIVQDAMLRIHKARDRFDCSMSFGTWAYTIVANLVKNEFRRRSRKNEYTFNRMSEDWNKQCFGEWGDESYAPDTLFHQRTLTQEVWDAVESLDDPHREAITLLLEGNGYEEIAQATGVPIGTVKSRLFRAKEKLRDMLGPTCEAFIAA